MSYEEALENYGSDKPDISFDYKVISLAKHGLNMLFK